MANTSHGIVALVRNPDGNFLLLEDSREQMRGHWAPPHGRCDSDDPTEADTVKREVLEETGLHVRPVRVVTTVRADTKVATVSFWTVEANDTSKIQLDQNESLSSGWFSVEDALRLKLYPGTKTFFEDVISGHLSLDS